MIIKFKFDSIEYVLKHYNRLEQITQPITSQGAYKVAIFDKIKEIIEDNSDIKVWFNQITVKYTDQYRVSFSGDLLKQLQSKYPELLY
jgi:hypothetical protein